MCRLEAPKLFIDIFELFWLQQLDVMSFSHLLHSWLRKTLATTLWRIRLSNNQCYRPARSNKSFQAWQAEVFSPEKYQRLLQVHSLGFPIYLHPLIYKKHRLCP